MAAQHLILLLQQPDPPVRLAQFSGLGPGHAGTVAVGDVGVTQPVAQARLGDPEVGCDLFDRSIPAASHGHDVVAELLGIGSGHDAHPSSGASGATGGCHLLVHQPQALSLEDQLLTHWPGSLTRFPGQFGLVDHAAAVAVV
nr:hypothetical protein [Cellulomonas palmilytica]